MNSSARLFKNLSMKEIYHICNFIAHEQDLALFFIPYKPEYSYLNTDKKLCDLVLPSSVNH